jgi:hypothetical protein
MSISINGVAFDDVPGSCATCGFFYDGRTDLSPGSEIGHCLLFNENHHGWCSPPRRCAKLLRKAMRFYPDGSELCIVFDMAKDDEQDDND